MSEHNINETGFTPEVGLKLIEIIAKKGLAENRQDTAFNSGWVYGFIKGS